MHNCKVALSDYKACGGCEASSAREIVSSKRVPLEMNSFGVVTH